MNNHLPASETQVFTNPIPIAVGHGPVTLSVRLLNRGPMQAKHTVQHRRLSGAEQPAFCKVGNVAECVFALLTGVYGRRWADWFLERWLGLQRQGCEGGCRFIVSDVRMTHRDVAVIHKRALRTATARRNHIAVTSYACSQARCLTSASGNNAGLNYEPTPCPSLTHPPPLKLPPKPQRGPLTAAPPR